MMTRIFYALCLWALLAAVSADEGGPPLLDSHANLDSKMNLQRGARTFVNYCLSCHSASFMRYSRVMDDLELSKEAVEKNLMFTTDKIGNQMIVAMRPADAEQWFGVAPPDLSVVARARGADWLYSFLMSFYRDDKRPTGVNNLYFPETAMPAVLSRLQGVQRKVATSGEEHAADAHGEGHAQALLELELPGTQSPEEYATTLPVFESIMNGFVYTQGSRYTDFIKGDKVAEYGLTALVVGGAGAAALKGGLLAKLWKPIALVFVKLWKVIALAAVALAGTIKKLIAKLFGKGEEEPEMPQP